MVQIQMKLTPRVIRLGFGCVLLTLSLPLRAGTASVHTTWLWHLHQPIYWPDRRNWGGDHYEAAWDTIQQQNAGRPHPSAGSAAQHLRPGRPRRRLSRPSPATRSHSVLGYPNAGAQVSYSGALMENVQSLGASRSTWLRRELEFRQPQARGLDHQRRQAAAWTSSTSPIITRWRRCSATKRWRWSCGFTTDRWRFLGHQPCRFRAAISPPKPASPNA